MKAIVAHIGVYVIHCNKEIEVFNERGNKFVFHCMLDENHEGDCSIELPENSNGVPMHPITLMGYRCRRCSHQWVPMKSTNSPKVCPSCKSPYWDRPRREDVKL